MRVSEYLELEDGSQLLERARRSWAGWVEQDPRLEVVAFDELREWLAATPPAQADEVLHALARLAASDGSDDTAAAALLAWVLLPGACALARELRSLHGEVPLMVAAQLWIEVRTFEWRRLRRVAGNILMNTRAGCLREVGTSGRLKRADRTWSVTDRIDPSSMFWANVAVGERSRVMPAVRHAGERPWPRDDLATPRATRHARMPPERRSHHELAEVLAWACENDVISEADRDLLVCLVEEAAVADNGRYGRSIYGLTAAEVAGRVAPRCGLAESTVRRRAARSIHALAAAAHSYVA